MKKLNVVKLFSSTVIVLVFTGLIVHVVAVEPKWSFQTIAPSVKDRDGRGGTIPSSLVLDSKGNPHVIYFEVLYQLGASLKYASLNGTSWNSQTVAYTQGRMHASLALDSNDNPHISYQDRYDNLNYAFYNGSVWYIQLVQAIDYGDVFSSLVLDSKNNPHISYSGYTQFVKGNLTYLTPTVKYTVWNDSDWITQVVDQTFPQTDPDEFIFWRPTVSAVSLVLGFNGTPNICYSNNYYQAVILASWSNGKWILKTIDTGDTDNLVVPALALDSQGNSHVSYNYFSGEYNYDGISHIKYASWTGLEWKIQVVNQTSDIRSFIALDSKDNPHIIYRSSEGLTYVTWTGVDWKTENVDRGSSGPLVLDSTGTPHIMYCNEKGDLKMAFITWLSPTETPKLSGPDKINTPYIVIAAITLIIIVLVFILALRRKISY